MEDFKSAVEKQALLQSIRLMGKDMPDEVVNRFMDEIKNSIAQDDLCEVEMCALMSDSPIYSELRMYCAEIGV